jgi:hypothetical protein
VWRKVVGAASVTLDFSLAPSSAAQSALSLLDWPSPHCLLPETLVYLGIALLRR